MSHETFIMSNDPVAERHRLERKIFEEEYEPEDSFERNDRFYSQKGNNESER